ncbi:MAG TPA: hemolysin III family protein [Gemmatimonadaceae bacterium]|jgi:hemolysin III|nr:hemolysin III family protein [Gemmatimonadaceae bacterium]
MDTGRPQTLGEEIANSITHGVGFLLSVAALPILIVIAVRHGDAWRVTAASIYGATLVLLYAASTLYHALPGERVKEVFRRCDHAAIYLLIAGTYTPFMLGPLRGPWGWSLFGVVWGLALIGVVCKGVLGIQLRYVSAVLYVAMGWLVLVAVAPLVEHVAAPGVWLIFAGGVLYTSGVAFYLLDRRIRFGHMVWHLFVLAGSAAQFWAVLGYAVQRAII